MLYHRALGRDLEGLVVAVIDNRRPMLDVMRAMLAAIGVGRIDTFESPTEAIGAMEADTPDVVIAAGSMQPLSGAALIHTMRRTSSEPLCFVPAMVMCTQSKPLLVEEALRAGAHQVLILPISVSTLYRRLDWLLNDDRPFERQGEYFIVAGMEERLSLSVQRPIYMTRPTVEFGAALEGERPEASPIAEAGPIARLARN